MHLAEKIKLGVFKKVSTRNYSEDLEATIAIMLAVDSKRRAKVEELLCLPRIQFTSKKLRLERRYCELKKKEHQFNTKMSEIEKKYKKRSMALLAKEQALKEKECELKQKEILLSSKRSLTSTTTCTDSRASVSPRHSIPSNLSPSSDKSSKLNAISPTYLRVNTSLTATNSMPDIAEIGCLHEELMQTQTEQKEEESPPRRRGVLMMMRNDDDDENSRCCTFSNDSKESIMSANENVNGKGNGGRGIGDIMADAKNFLMQKINVNDLTMTQIQSKLHHSDYDLMDRIRNMDIGGRNRAVAAQSCQNLKRYGDYIHYQS